MIEAKNLTMHYGNFVALDGASFNVGKGEVVGLLGPNGAGKSTTMKILTTFLYPTAGSAAVGGKSIVDNPIDVRRMIGYLPEVLPLYVKLEVAEYLDFVGRARGLRGAELKKRLDWVVDCCGLKPMFRKPIRELSKGYKQRTGIAQALIHDPEVIILDEPTSGLDPHQILEIRNLVKELAESKTIILSTHILQEAQAMAERIIIINSGKIVGQGTLGELRSQAHETNRVYFAADAKNDEVSKAISGLASVSSSELEGKSRFRIVGPDSAKIIEQLSNLALDKKWRVRELCDAPYSLEETFLALTESDAKKGGAA